MDKKPSIMTFKTLAQVDIPRSRNGKHKHIVSLILDDVRQLKDGMSIRVPLGELGDTKENVRSALNRASRKAGVNIATAADESFLYVWPVPNK
jgi:hypothetical protein